MKLVKEAKRRPLPPSTKVLFYILVVAMIFTGGAVYGKNRASSTTGAELSLSALGGTGGVGRFGRGSNGDGFSGARGSGSGAGSAGATGSGAAATTTTAADVAGTVVSISAKAVVIATLSGSNATFPITQRTKIRSSAKIDLSMVRVGDIVTIKPDESKGAKTIMVVK